MLTDRSIIDLGAGSTFKLDEYNLKNGEDRTVTMTLSQGKLRNSITKPVKTPGRFIIRTGAAIMGVRGTEFIVSAMPNAGQLTTQVTVIHGTVDYAPRVGPPGPPIQLGEGRQLTVSNHLGTDGRVLASAQPAAPQVTRLQAAEVQAVAHEAHVADTTFQKAVVVEKNNQGPTVAGAPPGSTLVAMARSFAPPPPPPPPAFGNMGAPGTGIGFLPPTTNPTAARPPLGIPVNVKVNFKP
ncbi:MAG: FecR domain-containing protein [Bdellovibrio sp.]|nr:FecR domain-containing protein [Bdellovibrio sp.]